jgi:hypothetical protein
MAPTIAPTHLLTGCICFNGVYTNAYRTRLEAASPAAKPLACTNLANFLHVKRKQNMHLDEYISKENRICIYRMQRESKNLPG